MGVPSFMENPSYEIVEKKQVAAAVGRYQNKIAQDFTSH